ncbi:branched-chain amino acid ABC transporter permease [Microvirga alba]|uniref:Branched-chain amino acid ABC transporter permease n=1 Tax=Microvirga alba TaxID=2791025 RepID=A0A931BP58_9HYPH|nr:branched-chain amino acid ABC transporter permease [Microvirga alba]MBF9234852.1 branched-chain amino acid ABC transporter permease [Microvirga alba]
MAILVEQVLNGINYGLLLFLIAAGLSLVFGVMHLINLAHGSLFMVGAFAAAAFAHITKNFLLSVICATLLAAAVGWLVERVIVRKLYARSHLDQVLATFGLILFANELLRWISGGVPQYVPSPGLFSGTVMLPGGIEYPAYRMMVTSIAAIAALAMWMVIAKTRAGMLVRASASNPTMVRHIGFDVGLISTLVFAVGAGLAGLAGALTGPLVSIEVGMGEQVLILSFVIVVIGGLGSIRGTFLAAMMVGLVDTLGRALMPLALSGIFSARAVSSFAPALSATLVYILMAVVLIMRPQGLFAR